MTTPKILLLDEPSLGLAPLLVQQIFQTIREINRQGTVVLLVEQNANLALRMADRAYVLEAGQIVLEGSRRGAPGERRGPAGVPRRAVARPVRPGPKRRRPAGRSRRSGRRAGP